jgi:NAD(P)-dependent dehydrogenase (short-subunit alcohol dehydrogenase family)
MTLLKDKVVLVSGGTQGIGAAVARAAVAEGAAVAVTGRRTGPGEALAARLREDGADAVFVRCDVTEVEACRAAVAATVESFGRVDSLVNAAGLCSRGTLLDTTPELFDAQVAVNLRGPFFLMQSVVAHLLERGSPGTIVNVISTSELGGQPYLAAYVAAKAGLAGLTRNVAHAHRFDRIRVNGLDIGWTATEGEDLVQRTFHDAGDDWREEAGRTLPMGRLGDPADVAAMVVLLLSERSGVVTGSVLDWDQNVFGGLG